MNSLWLQFRSNAPGLPGPFLQEHRDAYQICHGARQMAMTIGLPARRSPSPCKATPLVDDAQHGIWLRRLDHSTVIADCDLHLDMGPGRVRAGPQPGHLKLHQLGDLFTYSLADVAGRLYGEILFPLSCVAICKRCRLGKVPCPSRGILQSVLGGVIEAGQQHSGQF